MTDSWYEFWVKQGNGYQNGVNLRPSFYSYPDHVDYLHKKLNFKPTDNVLDVGCGNGQMMREIARYTKNISGVDHSPNMVTLSHNLAMQNGLRGKYILSCAHDLSAFGNDMFDVVICMAVLQYYEDKNQAIQAVGEMVRVCRPGGRVFVGDVVDARKMVRGVAQLYSYMPDELWKEGEAVDSYYEPQRRFDLLIRKK